MTSQQILTADFLDILFDNRNKEYGAYSLRKRYNSQMMKALSISIVTVFATIYFINPSGKTIVASDGPEIIVRDYVLPPNKQPKPEQPKPHIPKAATQVKQIEFQTPVIVDKAEIPPIAALPDLETAAVSNKTTEGEDAKSDIQQPSASNNGNGNTTKPEAETAAPPAPDRQPQFPGGMTAWSAFLNRHLQSPEELEPGEKRVVNIRFHVDADGTVTGFQVAQSGGLSFDNEVIRVLKKMPKWVPAMQGGRAVAVSFTQPVTFVAQD